MAIDLIDVMRWLKIREANGIRLSSLQQLEIDMDHSSLLKRLADRLEPLPEPPPRSFSYPWYDLIETGRGNPMEVFESFVDPSSLVINQFDEWAILERLGTDSWLTTYRIPDTALLAQLGHVPDLIPMKQSESRWKVHSPGPDPRNPEWKAWTLERVSDP